MTIFLIVVIAVLVIFILALLWLCNVLANRVFEARAEYDALDRGMDEQRDCFEQDALTATETIEGLNKELTALEAEKAELEAHLDKHDRECLPNHFDASWRPHVSTDENVDPPLYAG